ncbi:MAG TPA: phosphatidate cytidylyltransferase, partial [Solirubrobacteraceae bacterium]|nr:phosphatidate cytidylyltransferase [Solirubrobacteraceae bacterium]
MAERARPRRRARPAQASRNAREPRPPRGGDLLRRVLVAIPAIVFAIVIVAAGGWVFALGVLALGWICLHELFRMYERLRPVKLAGFIGLAGLAAAAQAGGEHQVLLALVAFIPVMFLLALAMPDLEGEAHTRTEGMALTTLG